MCYRSFRFTFFLPALSMADLAAIPPSSIARNDFNEPLKQPTGVLTALAITTSYDSTHVTGCADILTDGFLH